MILVHPNSWLHHPKVVLFGCHDFSVTPCVLDQPSQLPLFMAISPKKWSLSMQHVLCWIMTPCGWLFNLVLIVKYLQVPHTSTLPCQLPTESRASTVPAVVRGWGVPACQHPNSLFTPASDQPSVAPWLCPGTRTQWKAEPSIVITHHVFFAAAERDGGPMHSPYGFDLGHVTSNNLRGKKETMSGETGKTGGLYF